jgi:hypothetical protein
MDYLFELFFETDIADLEDCRSQDYLTEQMPDSFYRHDKYLQIKEQIMVPLRESYDLNHLAKDKYIHSSIFGKSNNFKR